MTNIVSKIGLEVVLEGLGTFGRDLTQANNLVKQFTKSTDDVGKSLSPVNKLLGFFAESLQRIGEFVIAGLIVRGFEKITSAIRDMVGAMITAGAEFQTLMIRLEMLQARELVTTGLAENFTEALAQAGPVAEDLFTWIQKLALTTPFDIQDVAQTVTFAKAYGMVGDEAKRVTSAIIDFASGMGLSSTQMQRIIENFGQMIQQGKVTSTELRDLGRGALVPINNVLEMMRENLGLTTEAFNDLREKGGLQVEDFIEAFIQLVGQDFPEAGKRASRTIQAVLGNLQDLLQGVLGFNIVRPILDVFSGKLAEMLDALTTGDRGERLIQISQQIGEALSGILSDFLGTTPGGDTIADFILEKLDIIKGKIIGLRTIIGSVIGGEVGIQEGVSAALLLLGLPQDFVDGVNIVIEKLNTVRDRIGEIVTGFQEGGLVGGLEAAGAPPAIIGFVENIQTALENIQIFWTQNKEQIMEIIDELLGALLKTGETGGETLLDILGEQISRLSKNLIEDGPSVLDWIQDFSETLNDDLVPAVREIGDWLTEHQDQVVDILIALGLLAKITPLVLAFAGALVILLSPLGAFIAIIAGVTYAVLNLKSTIDIISGLISQIWQIVQLLGYIVITKIVETLQNAHQSIKNTIGSIIDTLARAGYNAMMGFSNEFHRVFDWFVANVWIKFRNFISWLKALLGIASPSKVFEELGKQTIEGYAKGILENFALPENAMRQVIAATIAPAVSLMPSGGGTTNNTTVNNTLNINSSAKREPVIADFRMMQSWVSR